MPNEEPQKKRDPLGWIIIPCLMVGILVEVGVSIIFDRLKRVDSEENIL